MVVRRTEVDHVFEGGLPAVHAGGDLCADVATHSPTVLRLLLSCRITNGFLAAAAAVATARGAAAASAA